MNDFLLNLQNVLQDYSLVMFVIMISAVILWIVASILNIIFYYENKETQLDLEDKVDKLALYVEILLRKH